MKSSKLFSQTGQSLLEVIIAMAIFAFLGSFMASFLVGSFVGLERGGEQTQAEALAQEGIEAVRSIRDSAWNKVLYNQSAVVLNSGQWVFSGEGTTEQIGQFSRNITFNDVCRDTSDEIITCPGDYTDIHSKKITVAVDWDPTIGITNSVQQVSYLTNWDSREWIQTNWSGGSGQSIWSNQTKYFSDDNNVNISTSGEAKLKISLATEGSHIWPFDVPGDYTYNSSKIDIDNGIAQLIKSGGSFPIDKPTITPINSLDVSAITRWTAFTENADKGGNCAGNQILDDTENEFNQGSYSDTEFNTDHIELTATGITNGSGTYNSQIFYSGGSAVWDTISWTPKAPYGKELPDNKLSESNYTEGNANMGNNAVLLHFNESVGSTVFDDTSGSANNANCSSDKCPIAEAGGKFNTALDFDGDNDYLEINNTIGNNFTLETWIKTSVDSSSSSHSQRRKCYYGNGIVWSDVGGFVENDWILSILNNKICWWTGNPDTGIISNGTVNDGEWHHVVATRIKNGDKKIFIDGIEQNEVGTSNNKKLDSNPIIHIGGNTYDDNYFDGIIDEVAIYNRVLSDNEILDHYKRGVLNLKYQLRSCYNSDCTGEAFVGPDGTDTDYYSEINNNTVDLPSFDIANIENNPYFQYQAIFKTDSSYTPELNGVAADYTCEGTVGEIYYQLSNDSGSTWQYWNGGNWENDPDGDEGVNENDYNTADVVNYYINQFSTSTKSLAFKAFLASDGSPPVKLDSIEAAYDITSGAHYGSSFEIDNTFGGGLISKNTDWTSLRFKAKNSKTVNSIRVYLEQEKGNSPTYRYGLQSDNNGEPSGIWLGDNNLAYNEHQATSTGWQTITLNEGASLTINTTYHLVVRHLVGEIGGANAIELRQSDPNNFIHPYDSSSNSSGNVLWSEDSGNSWSVQGHQPIYVLDFSDATHEGNPYHESTVHDIYSNDGLTQTFCFGEQITITGTDKMLSEVSFLVSENNQGPEDDLYITVYDVTNSVQLESGIIATDNDTINTEYKWVTYTFSSPIELITGNTYRAYLCSPLSYIQKHYLVRSVHHDDITELKEINYDGLNSYFIASNDGGATWDTTNDNYDINGFRFNKTIYMASGEIISSAFDMGVPSKTQTIEWDETIPSCSPPCEVKMQIQTAPDNSGSPGAWSTWCGSEGKDGDETDYFSNSNGELIHTDNNGGQWIRYRALLTGDSVETPVLEEININYK